MKLAGHEVGLQQPFFLIAGPCVIEGPTLTQEIAGRAARLVARPSEPMARQRRVAIARSHCANSPSRLLPLGAHQRRPSLAIQRASVVSCLKRLYDKCLSRRRSRII